MTDPNPPSDRGTPVDRVTAFGQAIHTSLGSGRLVRQPAIVDEVTELKIDIPKARDVRLSSLLVPVLLLISVILVFWKVSLTSEFSMITGPDNCYQTYSWLQFANSEVRDGRLPQWNPFSQSGQNFIAELQTGVFGPLQALTYLVPTNRRGRISTDVIEGVILLGYWLSALLMYQLCGYLGLARIPAFVSSICFIFSGFMGTRAVQQANVFLSAVWLPGMFLFYLRALQSESWRWRLLHSGFAGLFIALSFLSGHHQAIGLALISFVVIAGHWIVEKRTVPPWRNFSVLVLPPLAGAFGLCLAGIQTLPTMEYAATAVRWASGAVLPGQRVAYYALQHDFRVLPHNLLGLLFRPFEHGSDGTIYFGLLPLALAAIGILGFRQNHWVRCFSVLAGISFLYSLGSFSLLHGVANALLPGLDKLREAIRALLITHFSLAILAGFGASYLFSARAEGSILLRRVTRALLVLALVGWGTVMLWLAASAFMVQKTPGSPLDTVAFSSLILLLSAWGVRMARSGRTRPGLLAALLLSVIFLDYGQFVGEHLQAKAKYPFYPSKVYEESEALTFLRSQTALYRYYDPDGLLPPNAGNIYRLQAAWGYGATSYYPYWRFLMSDVSLPSTPLALLNVRYLVTKEALPGWKTAWESDAKGIRIIDNPAAFPRAWVVHRGRAVRSFDESLELILSKEVDLRSEVLVRDSKPIDSHPVDPPTATVTSWEPGRLVVRTDASAPGYLVLSEINYPGWKGFVDGKSYRPIEANGVLMAFPISSGRQVWEIRYLPGSFRWGMFLSFSSLFALALLGWLARGYPDRTRGLGRSTLANSN